MKMIFVIAGPSGAGKTSLIKYVKSNFQINIIHVFVYSNENREYTDDPARIKINLSDTCRMMNEGFTYNKYDFNYYFYKLNNIDEEKSWLLDYPGDYPSCIELSNHNYIGILVLPKDVESLALRLKTCNRDSRIESSIKEYNECCEEVKKGLYNSWHVIINSNYTDFHNKINEVFSNYDRIF